MATEETKKKTKKQSVEQLRETITQLKDVTESIIQKVKNLESIVGEEDKKILDQIDTNSQNPVNSQAVVDYLEKRLSQSYAVIAKDICAIQDGKETDFSK